MLQMNIEFIKEECPLVACCGGCPVSVHAWAADVKVRWLVGRWWALRD